MKIPYEEALRRQLREYLSSICVRIRFTNGGRSNLEIAVEPDIQGSGVFLYMIDNGREGTTDPKKRQYVRLTPKNARRVGHALLFAAGEAEVHEDEEVLSPAEG